MEWAIERVLLSKHPHGLDARERERARAHSVCAAVAVGLDQHRDGCSQTRMADHLAGDAGSSATS